MYISMNLARRTDKTFTEDLVRKTAQLNGMLSK